MDRCINRNLDEWTNGINTCMVGWMNKERSDRKNGYIAERVFLSVLNPLINVRK